MPQGSKESGTQCERGRVCLHVRTLIQPSTASTLPRVGSCVCSLTMYTDDWRSAPRSSSLAESLLHARWEITRGSRSRAVGDHAQWEIMRSGRSCELHAFQVVGMWQCIPGCVRDGAASPLCPGTYVGIKGGGLSRSSYAWLMFFTPASRRCLSQWNVLVIGPLVAAVAAAPKLNMLCVLAFCALIETRIVFLRES